MKVRFVGGPFGGQAKEMAIAYGTNEIVMRGPKKLTRKQRYEVLRAPNLYGQSHVFLEHRVPIVTARYRIAMRVHTNGGSLVNMPCMHPDGSLFYEFIEGSKTEL